MLFKHLACSLLDQCIARRPSIVAQQVHHDHGTIEGASTTLEQRVHHAVTKVDATKVLAGFIETRPIKQVFLDLKTSCFDISFCKIEDKITLLRVIPTITFQNSLLTPLLSEAFVTGLLPN